MIVHERIEDVVQLPVLDEEPVVPERRIYFVVRASGDHAVQFAHLCRGENDVGRDADHCRAGFDACEGGCYPAAPAPRVVGVEGVEYGIVRVGVVAPAEFLALILLVGRCAVYCGEFLPVLLREVVSQRTPVREQPQGACGSQSGHPGVVSRLAERRVGLDGHALGLVDGNRPGRGLGRRGDQDQFADALRLQDRPFDGLESPDRTSYERVDAADAERRVERQRALFEHYGLAPEVEDMYPFELSGGMARRVLLASALVESPRLIVADEPTPGLDLDLAVRALDDLRAFADAGGGVLLITHDIELALRVADRIAVFKDGTVIEETAVESFNDPSQLRHPFSRELWRALPGNGFSVPEEAIG